MRSLLIFSAAYVVGLFTYGLIVESPLAILYTGITVLLFAVFAAIHRWARWPLHALWAMSLVGLGNMLGGVLLVDGMPLYVADLSPLPRYDKVFHTIAAAAMFVVAWEAMKRFAGEGYHLSGLLMWTWLVTMGGGAVVELAEFVGSVTAPVNVGDYGNNMLDIVANGLGAALAWAFVHHRERKSPVAISA